MSKWVHRVSVWCETQHTFSTIVNVYPVSLLWTATCWESRKRIHVPLVEYWIKPTAFINPDLSSTRATSLSLQCSLQLELVWAAKVTSSSAIEFCRHTAYHYVIYHSHKKDVTWLHVPSFDHAHFSSVGFTPIKGRSVQIDQERGSRVSTSPQSQTKITNRGRDFDVSQQCRLISDRIWGDFDFDSRSEINISQSSSFWLVRSGPSRSSLLHTLSLLGDRGRLRLPPNLLGI